MKEIMDKFLDHNHNSYLQNPLKIGFTTSFPEDPTKVMARINIEIENSSLEARFVMLSFGPNNEHHVSGIVTNRFRIDRRGGWGNHEYIDEAKIMNKVALHLMKQQGLMVCDHVCSWPFVKLIVQKPTDAHLINFAKEHNT